MPTPPTSTVVAAAPAASRRKIDWTKFGASKGSDDGHTWRPAAAGDVLTGTIARVADANTRYGVKTVIEFSGCTGVIAGGEAQPDGDYSCWPTPGLLNALYEAEIDQGDRSVITLTELIDTGKGNAYKAFTVEASF